MNTPIEKAPQVETSVQSGADHMVVPSVEKVGEIVASSGGGKDDQAVVTTQTTGILDFAFADRIRNLLFQPKKTSLTLPPPKTQKMKVKKALIKEKENLLKQAEKIQRSRRFSAYKLERVIQQIRYLQELLEEMVSTTVERIERLYRQYVLKTN